MFVTDLVLYAELSYRIVDYNEQGVRDANDCLVLDLWQSLLLLGTYSC